MRRRSTEVTVVRETRGPEKVVQIVELVFLREINVERERTNESELRLSASQPRVEVPIEDRNRNTAKYSWEGNDVVGQTTVCHGRLW